MNTDERQEQLRQAVMRMRELLDLMEGYVTTANRQYDALFVGIADGESSTGDKALQGMAAARLVQDHAPLARLVLDMRFHARALEREFDVLYGNIVSVSDVVDEE